MGKGGEEFRPLYSQKRVEKAMKDGEGFLSSVFSVGGGGATERKVYVM